MRLVRVLAPVLLALTWLASPVLADTPAQVDPARTLVEIVGKDRGKPRPVSLVIGLSRAVPHRIAIIDDPPRLVVDLRETSVPDGPAGADDPLALRWGPAPQGGARAVLPLPGPMALDHAHMTAAAQAALTIELAPVAPEAFQPRPDPNGVLRGLPEPARTDAGPTAAADGRLRVVLDAGHGGFDPGAQVDGVSEAALMLGFSLELATVLRELGVEVVLTRENDSFVALEDRTTVARARGADLFISLHADALPAGEAAGATIYVWDAQSNDRAARQLALMHDRSDILAGLDLSDADEDVSHALMDLARLDTQPRSADAARVLAAELNAAGVQMHRIPIRGAAFSVLKSPDIPSLLIELGFLTDPDDRANLLDPAWRARMARALAAGIIAWHGDPGRQPAPER